MKKHLIFVLLSVGVLIAIPQSVSAAQLLIGPTTGTFTVGSTFEVSLFLDTERQSVNAFSAELLFPPEKLQLVSPTAGKSIIGVWTAPPQFNNQTGAVNLAGGIPNGITTNQGLVSTFTFRVRQVGTAALRFGDSSRVLLNDGKGTDVLQLTQGGIYNLTLPPPAGPLVVSETHPDQSRWYVSAAAIFNWEVDGPANGYSYVLSDTPVEVPDNISEGTNRAIAYKQLGDGTRYFHIKALRGGVWGGITHFAVNIDTIPPARFPIRVAPAVRTTSRTPIIELQTTDAHSGIDHYEFKVVPLEPIPFGAETADAAKIPGIPFFIETEGKQVLNLDFGSYHVIARAYDRAGNFREEIERLAVTTPLGLFISREGLYLGGGIILPWLWILAALIAASGGLFIGARRARSWHHSLVKRHTGKELPPEVDEKLRELRAYRQKYGKLAMFLFCMGVSFFGIASDAVAATQLSPPIIQTISRSIANDEIFYAGGVVDTPKAEIILYLQNLETGETLSETTIAGTNQEWFYRYNSFLTTGDYLIWAQARVGEEVSPPSPQFTVQVRKTAFEFGGSRFSYEFFYLAASIVLFLAVIGLTAFIIIQVRHGRRRHRQFSREVREAEESVRRGFAVLKRDIEAELALVHKMKANNTFSSEEKGREEELLKDLSQIERHIGKEIWDIERVEASA